MLWFTAATDSSARGRQYRTNQMLEIRRLVRARTTPVAGSRPSALRPVAPPATAAASSSRQGRRRNNAIIAQSPRHARRGRRCRTSIGGQAVPVQRRTTVGRLVSRSPARPLRQGRGDQLAARLGRVIVSPGHPVVVKICRRRRCIRLEVGSACSQCSRERAALLADPSPIKAAGCRNRKDVDAGRLGPDSGWR